MKVVRLSALCTGRLYPPGNIPGIHFCWRLSQPQGHSAAGRIMSMKNYNDTIGNRTRDLLACSVVMIRGTLYILHLDYCLLMDALGCVCAYFLTLLVYLAWCISVGQLKVIHMQYVQK